MTGGVSQFELTGSPWTAPVQKGEVVAGKYVIGEELGVGGMGVVVAARDQLLDRKVAIKFLLPTLATSEIAVSRFKREARLATRITSPHVVTLLEIEQLPNGTPFFAMEYLEGRDLRKVLGEDGPLTAADAVDYLLQATEAVAEGHLRGIVHRDIKPSNLFLTQRADGSPLVKVLDFGIAKALERDAAVDTKLTHSNDFRLGSTAYMSPEQLLCPHDVDVRSDLWALGVTLYELVSGRRPFDGSTPVELMIGITKEAPRPLQDNAVGASFPRELESCILHCLEKDRERRFQNAAELAEALVAFGSDEARVSLRRIRGPRSTLPPSLLGSAPTLAVAAPSIPPSDTPVTREDPQGRAAARRRSVGVAVALVTLVCAVLVSLKQVGRPDPPVNHAPGAERRPAGIGLGSPSSAVPTEVTPVVTTAATAAAAPPATISAPRRATVRPRVQDAKVEPAPVASVIRPQEHLSANPEQPLPPAPSGRSPVIERLIERRH